MNQRILISLTLSVGMVSAIQAADFICPPVSPKGTTALYDSLTLEQVVVTATHTPKALKDVPVVTRLISLDDIKKADATNIQDLLVQELPGLEFGFAMTQETSLNMSGFGGNAVLFLVDGERVAGETVDNTDYNRLNLDNVGRIEIVKGASPALYGSNAVGGVINIITRESTEPWTANVNSRYSSFGKEWRNGANFSFTSGKWNSQTNFQHTDIEPIKLASGPTSEEKALAALLGQEIEEDKSNVKKLYGQESYNVKERITFTASDFLKFIARGGYFYRESQRDTYNYHFNAYSGGLKAIYDWKNGRNIEVSYAYDQYDKANYTPEGKRTHDHDYRNTQHVVHAIYNHTLGEHVLTLGSDLLHDYLTTYQFLDNTSHEQNNIDAFAQFDFNPNRRINVVGSVRYDYFSASDAQAFIILCSGLYNCGVNGIELTQISLSAHIGEVGKTIIAVAILFFAFSSVIGNYYYGESNVNFLCNGKSYTKAAIQGYRVILAIIVFLGSLMTIDIVWALVDFFMVIMTTCNLIAITFLGKYAIILLNDYKQQRLAGKNPEYKADTCKEIANETECW